MSDRIEAPGIYPDMRTEDYFADPCPWPSLTQSIAKILLDRSPRHAWHAHPRLNPDWKPDEDKYEKAKAIGNAAHKIVLGRGKRLEVVRTPKREKQGNKWVVPDASILEDADDFKTDAASEEKDRIAAAGGVPILRKHFDVAASIADAARAQLDFAGCGTAFRHSHGNAEVVITAFDEEYGIWLRSMVDWLETTTMLYDLKTGETSAAPHAIPRRMVDQGWDVQAAMQERILDILDPKNAGKRRFRFVAIEDDQPYGLTVNELSDYSPPEIEGFENALDMGRRKVRRACDIWSECMRRNEWPIYPPMINHPPYPGYAASQWLNREINETGQRRLPSPVPFVPEVINAG